MRFSCRANRFYAVLVPRQSCRASRAAARLDSLGCVGSGPRGSDSRAGVSGSGLGRLGLHSRSLGVRDGVICGGNTRRRDVSNLDSPTRSLIVARAKRSFSAHSSRFQMHVFHAPSRASRCKPRFDTIDVDTARVLSSFEYTHDVCLAARIVSRTTHA